jgi:hypothetical protein
MKQRSSLGFILLLVALVVAGGTGLWSQWLQTMALRTELESARAEVGELARLRAENTRLRAQQLPPAQLEALRADHAALPRLRAELEALNKPISP